jgi:hypothetical protein
MAERWVAHIVCHTDRLDDVGIESGLEIRKFAHDERVVGLAFYDLKKRFVSVFDPVLTLEDEFGQAPPDLCDFQRVRKPIMVQVRLTGARYLRDVLEPSEVSCV